MGEVYRAEDLRLGQSVALKFLPPAVAEDPQRLAQFHHEVRIARQVSHRNVCRVYDIGEDHGRVFLTMELIDGEDLAGLLKRIGRFPEERATEIARQICAGLAAAHDCGVLHRDLKPANIMLDADGRVRITDFGLAGLAGTFTDIRSGTPAYMAPEQLAGKDVTERSDLFSLGLVLFEIYTGKRAFDATTIAELLRLHDDGVQAVAQRRARAGSGGRARHPALPRAAIRPSGRRARSPCRRRCPAAIRWPRPSPPGETPSPAMVAAAGRMDAVPLRIGLGCHGRDLRRPRRAGRPPRPRRLPPLRAGGAVAGRCSSTAPARRSPGSATRETPVDCLRRVQRRRRLSRVGRRQRDGADRWKELAIRPDAGGSATGIAPAPSRSCRSRTAPGRTTTIRRCASTA